MRSGAAWTDEYQVDAMGSVLRHDGNRAESHWRGTLSDYVSDRLIGTTALTGADVGHTSGWPGVTKVQDQAFSFDSSGNQRSGTVRAREYVPNSDPAVYNDVLVGTSWSWSFYGADDRLRAFQRTGVDGTGMRTTFIEHRYDALGRRVLTRTQRDSTCSAGVPTCLSTIDRFVWDGDQLLAEHRINAPYTTQGEALEAEYSAGTLGGGGSQSNFLGAIRYTHGPGIDEPLVVWQTGDPFVPHANVRGGFEAGSRLDGSMLSMYWPALDRTAYHAPDVRAPAGSPTHWVGSLMDRQADASGLMYMRNRYYDPASGRFTQEDPIGLAGGLNLYGFAGGDPVNRSDPFGLCPDPDDPKCSLGQQVADAAVAQLRGLFNTVGDAGNALKVGLESAGKWALREGAIQMGFMLATQGAGTLASGLRQATPALAALYSEGSIAGRSIIGIRSTLIEGGFKMTLSRNRQGYLFENGVGEEVRIMRRAGGWDVRVRNGAGAYLDHLGNVARDKASSHGIRVFSR